MTPLSNGSVYLSVLPVHHHSDRTCGPQYKDLCGPDDHWMPSILPDGIVQRSHQEYNGTC